MAQISKFVNWMKSTVGYDAAGNRVNKFTGVKNTWYVRDAQGNTLAVYDDAGNAVTWREQHLYGSSRLGIWQADVNLATAGAAQAQWKYRGLKRYELSNHLGNVLATISDRRLQHPTVEVLSFDYYNPDVLAAQDYYPFGMIQPGRTYAVYNGAGYRYGFNGQENDNEVKGTGNQIDFGERMYDPRIGRFLSFDKQFKLAADLTPYRFSFNNPIRYVDKDGNYETDGHYWTVYMIGLMIGLDNPTAQHLAALAEKPDNDVHSNYVASTQNYTWSDATKQHTMHSLRGSGMPVQANLNFAINQLLRAQNDDDLSAALHYFGDAFAHQRMDGKGGYYGDYKSNITWKGKVFEALTGASVEHSEAVNGNGTLGNAPDLIYNRPDLYKSYVQKLANVLGDKYNKNHSLDMAVINRMVNYAQQNKVSLIGIINYEVSKLRNQKSFFIAKDNGLASDAYKDYINNTKKYLESQGINYSTKTIYTETHNNNRTGPVKVEQGTKFIVK